jgi:hypothetical protein
MHTHAHPLTHISTSAPCASSLSPCQLLSEVSLFLSEVFSLSLSLSLSEGSLSLSLSLSEGSLSLWATSAQGWCYPTGCCAYLPSVTCYRQSKSLLLLLLSLWPPPPPLSLVSRSRPPPPLSLVSRSRSFSLSLKSLSSCLTNASGGAMLCPLPPISGGGGGGGGGGGRFIQS